MSEQANRVKEIRERANAATAGEWEQANKSVRVAGTQLDYGCYKAAPTGFSGGICNCLGGGYQDGKNHPVNIQAVKNAAFIAHAHQDIPYLLGLLDQLQRETEPVPLTMDELRAMNGKPAYIVVIDKTNIANPDDAFNGWGMVRWSWVRMWDAKRADLVHVDHDFCENGKTWIAFAHEPKGEATT